MGVFGVVGLLGVLGGVGVGVVFAESAAAVSAAAKGVGTGVAACAAVGCVDVGAEVGFVNPNVRAVGEVEFGIWTHVQIRQGSGL